MDGSHNNADLTAIIGATGSGKSTRIKRMLDAERPRRLLVWDWKGEYPIPHTSDPAELAAIVGGAGKRGAFVIAYRPTGKERPDWVARQFDIFCRVALAAGNCRVVVEELSNVTTAGWAPQPWRNVCTEGRHEALRVIGTSQRPALMDKTLLSNATAIYCGRLNFGADKKALADAMDVPVAEIRALGKFQWLAKDCESGEVCRDDLGAIPQVKKRRGRR